MDNGDRVVCCALVSGTEESSYAGTVLVCAGAWLPMCVCMGPVCCGICEKAAAKGPIVQRCRYGWFCRRNSFSLDFLFNLLQELFAFAQEMDAGPQKFSVDRFSGVVSPIPSFLPQDRFPL